MSAKIEPALTADEWAKVVVQGDAVFMPAPSPSWDIRARFDGTDIGQTGRHSLAALCLHGQPFGFTWEDVDTMDDVILREEASPPDFLDPADGPRWLGDLRSLRDRIAALLPPRPSPER